MTANEESVFTEALAKADPLERAAFLDQACAGNPALRESVESLLAAYNAGSFLETPAVKRPHHERKVQSPGSSTQGEPVSDANAGDSLEFLAPAGQPGVLGRLGHYDILEVIGRGGMGIVLRAFDAKLHRVVAIKVMAAQLATSGTARQRFTREAQAAAAVSHDHVVTIHAVDEANGLPYLVMQCVSGLSLQQRLDRSGPLQLAEIVRIGMQTAAGLAAAHAQGLVHRDIKPANVLLENGIERVKITDFGLARAATDASLTQSGLVAGTPQYMSPEQAEGKTIDQRSDLFSLGSVLYAMCTGLAPFRAASSLAVLKRVCEEVPRPIRATNPDIPDWLVAIIEKLHAKDPAGRYQTAAEVAELLNQHLAHLQHPSLVPLPVIRSAKARTAWRRRMVVAAALLSLIACTIVLIATWSGFFAPEDTPDANGGPAAKPDSHPFVVLGGKGVAERKFGSLAEAVQAASDGDTIEVRGNGPFASGPINLANTALTIRAGAGFRPVIKFSPPDGHDTGLLTTSAPLVLEGLELLRMPPISADGWQVIVYSHAPLYAVNCRFVGTQIQNLVSSASALCELRNCEFLCRDTDTTAVVWDWDSRQPGTRLVITNCLHTGTIVVGNNTPDDKKSVSIQLTSNTSVTQVPLRLVIEVEKWQPALKGDGANKVLRVEAAGNVFDASSALSVWVTDNSIPGMLTKGVGWKGEGNVFSMSGPFLSLGPPGKGLAPSKPLNNLADWKQFWGSADAGSIEGKVRYQGEDLLARLAAGPEKLTPDDFRLHPDSAGYKAGKGGKNLGADVDLVGPGKACEKWKQTPEYQKWLKDTGQLK